MKLPEAQKNRQLRVDDVIIMANIIDDMRNFDVEQPNRKKALICHNLVLHEVLLLETFIEEIVIEAQEFLLENVQDPQELGFDVLMPVSNDLVQRKDKRSIWNIAGNKWKECLRAHRKTLTDGFHTPRPDNVDALVLETIGLKSISKSWRWQGAPNTMVIKKINDVITMRGAIAHHHLSAPKINFGRLVNKVMFSRRACEITANEIRAHVFKVCGKYPWDILSS